MLLIRCLVVLCLAGLINACGLFEGKDDLAYKNAQSAKPLDIPQDLNKPDGIQRLEIPGADEGSAVDPEQLEKPPQIVNSVDLAELDSEAAADAKAKKAAQSAPAKGVTSVLTHNEDGASLLLVEAGFDQVWPLLGPALEELGFAIDDSNKGARVYVISKTLPVVNFDDEPVHPGDEQPDVKEQYQIRLQSSDGKTRIAVHNKFGTLESSGLSEHLLLQIKQIIANPAGKQQHKG